jgi:predicted metalloprotease with PDZ domain
MRLNRIRPLVFLVSIFALAAPAALAADAITLTVDATGTQKKLLHARMEIPVKPGPLTLYYPKWIPGEHQPSGPISDLVGLHFESGDKSIPWQRDTLDVFTFHLQIPDGVSHLTASYDFIEREGYSASDKVMALEWNDVLLYPAGTLATELTYDASIQLPEGWKFGTALPIDSQSGNKATFKPASLDRLVDSPLIAGQYYRAVDITPPGEPIHHELDMVADSAEALNLSPENQKEMVNLVAEAGKLFGARHYRDYHFLLTLSDHVAHFGLEHHESNDSRLPERALLMPSSGMSLGGLLAHEYAHSWNGKFRRPADLTVPYYEQPMETDLLWGYEGLTDYVGPLLAARSGLWTPDQYHEYLASIAAMLGPGRPGRTWRPLVDTATGEPGVGEPGPGGREWLNERRGTDYYDEGDLLWLEVATIIHQQTNGAKSIDDFCHLFHGGPNNGPEVKPYTFEDLVSTLNTVAPYDWATFLHQRLDSTSPEAPTGGIENGGWKVIFNEEPSKLQGRRAVTGEVYSIGLQVGPDGMVADSIVGGPAFQAGVSAGMKVVGVNGRVFTPELLADAVNSAKDPSQPITLLVVSDDYYRTCVIDYHGGPRYPHLVREDGKPDYIDELIKPHAAGQ